MSRYLQSGRSSLNLINSMVLFRLFLWISDFLSGHNYNYTAHLIEFFSYQLNKMIKVLSKGTGIHQGNDIWYLLLLLLLTITPWLKKKKKRMTISESLNYSKIHWMLVILSQYKGTYKWNHISDSDSEERHNMGSLFYLSSSPALVTL